MIIWLFFWKNKRSSGIIDSDTLCMPPDWSETDSEGLWKATLPMIRIWTISPRVHGGTKPQFSVQTVVVKTSTAQSDRNPFIVPGFIHRAHLFSFVLSVSVCVFSVKKEVPYWNKYLKMVTTWESVPAIFYKSHVTYYFKMLSLQQVQFYFVRKKCILIHKMCSILARHYFLKKSKLLQNFTPGNTPTSSNLAILVSYWQINLLLLLLVFFWNLALYLHCAVVERWKRC